MPITTLAPVNEGTSALLTGTLLDLDDTPIQPESVTTIKATLVCLDDVDQNGEPVIVNNRTEQSVFGTNGGQLAAGGVFTLVLTPADNAMQAESRSYERHQLTLVIGYGSGRTGVLRFLIPIHNTERL